MILNGEAEVLDEQRRSDLIALMALFTLEPRELAPRIAKPMASSRLESHAAHRSSESQVSGNHISQASCRDRISSVDGRRKLRHASFKGLRVTKMG